MFWYNKFKIIINLLKGGLTKSDFKAFACIVGHIIMINQKNTYFKSEIMKNQANF